MRSERASAVPIDARAAADLAAESGLVGRGADAIELAGGVSGTVILVDDGTHRVVVKQALARLKVADNWRARPQRALTEAAALDVAARATPGACPRILHVDPARCLMIMEAAPADWVPWKVHLLSGRVDVSTASALGSLLATWHTATAGNTEVAVRFGERTDFEQLRIDPYYRTVAARLPRVAHALGRLIDASSQTRTCLVHGDLSPKNVLVGDRRRWVIDWEVAHVGDPAFDVAFLTSHLILKAIRAGDPAPFRDATAAFRTAYDRAAGPIDQTRVAQHLGALLLARVHGKSPVEYLDDRGYRTADRVGTALLDDRRVIDEPWELLS